MSSIIFRVPLTCANCRSLNDENSGELYTPGIGYEAGHTFADLGDVLELELIDFEDGYFAVRRAPQAEPTFSALEIWGCKVCCRVQIARLRFEQVDPSHWRFTSAEVVPLSSEVLDEANFISRRLDQWAPNPGDDVDRVRAIQRRVGLIP